MAQFSYSELIKASQGESFSKQCAFESARLWTDTRTLQAGDFFLPLRGERFDGHEYLRQAFEAGALGAFVQTEKAKKHPEWQAFPNLIAVTDPMLAYLAMARLHREKINPLVIAVTGSSGKTTTKEMLYAAFSPLKNTKKTEKNFNNEVGVSQTLLSLTPEVEVLIVEMGMRGLRQISILSKAARPDVAIIVNVGPAHIGLLGSLENIARAKLEIAEGLSPDSGVLVINADNPTLDQLAPTLWPGKTLRYHLSEADKVESVPDALNRQAVVRFEYQGVSVTLSVPGEHMVANALGVLKVGEALGFSPAQLAPGLANFKPEKGRWEQMPLSGYQNVWVIDDAYNANPDSARASLKAFLETRRPGSGEMRNILILGGMKELGDFSQDYHTELGHWLSNQPNIDAVFTVGEEAPWMREAMLTAPFPVSSANDVSELVRQVREKFSPLQDAVLYMKGSRAYKLDQLPALLSQESQPIFAGEGS